LNSAAGFEDIVTLIAVQDIQAVFRSRSNALYDLFAKPTQVNHNIFDASPADMLEMPLQQALPANFDQTFGHRVR
jgi:hypothetical protein